MGKSSRLKQARKEREQDERTIQEVRLRSRRIVDASDLRPQVPPLSVRPVETLALGAYEETMAAGVQCFGGGVDQAALGRFNSESGRIFDFYTSRAYSLFEERTGERPDCDAGCNWCCHLRVTVHAHEGIGVTQALAALPDSTRQAVLARAKAHKQATDKMEPLAILRTARLCPLNEEGKCLVYKDRPLACRRAHSYSVHTCRTYVETGKILPNRTSAYIDEIARFMTAAQGQVYAHYKLDARAPELVDLLIGLDSDPALGSLLATDPESLSGVVREDVETAAKKDLLKLMGERE